MKDQKHKSINTQIQKLKQIINYQTKNQIKQQTKPKRYIIGVCGIPGSGKSTISQKLKQKLTNSIILPMDGFHIARKLLTQEGMKRRGASFTFDLSKFQEKMNEIKISKMETIKYPNFDHKQKDPVQDAIQIKLKDQILIVEGIYVFDKHLKINNQSSDNKIWDLKIWVDSELEQSIQRVAKRHLVSEIQPTYIQAYNRASTNDRTNALYVIQNCFDRQKFKNLEEWKQADIAIILKNSES